MSEIQVGPLGLLREATRKVPVVRYALAVAAIGAAIAITRGFMPGVSLAGMFPVLVGFILVMVVLILVAAAANSRPTVSAPALVLVWGVCLFVMTFMAFTVTAIAFSWPPAWARLILPASAAETPIIPPRTEAPETKATASVAQEAREGPAQTPPSKPAPRPAVREPSGVPAEAPKLDRPASSSSPAAKAPAALDARPAAPDPLASVGVYYYAKTSDGDVIRNALRRSGIKFAERPTHKTGTVPINAIACSADVSGAALRKLIGALSSAGVRLRLVQQFESSGKRKRIEVLTYSYHYEDGREEGLANPPLSAAQLNALQGCPVLLSNGPVEE